MTTLNARIWNKQVFSYCPHTSDSGELGAAVRSGITSSAGASDGTTVIDATCTSTGAGFVGYWIEILSGTYLGEKRRIVADNASGTFTIEGLGFGGQIASAVNYRLFQSPQPLAIASGSGSTTTLVCADRDEASGYWNSFYLRFIGGTAANIGKIVQITGFTNSTGTFTWVNATDGTALSSTAAGDVAIIERFIEVEGLSLNLTRDYTPRPSGRSYLSVGSGNIGARGGSISFSTVLSFAGTTALASAEDSYPTRGRIAQMLNACGFQEQRGLSVTVGAGATTSVIPISTGKHSNLVVGMMISDADGNYSFVTDKTDGGGSADTIYCDPPFPAAPGEGSYLSGSIMYYKSYSTVDTYGICLMVEKDGIRYTCTGCKGNVTLVDGNPVKLNWEFQVDDWNVDTETLPITNHAIALYDSSLQAAHGHTKRCNLIANTQTETNHGVLMTTAETGIVNSAINIGNFTCSMNAAFQPRNVTGAYGTNGRCGFQLTGYDVKATFRELASNSDYLTQELRWNNLTALKIQVVYGSRHQMIGILIPKARMIQYPMIEESDGMVAFPYVLEAQDAGFIDCAGTVPTFEKMPDFCICFI